MGKGLGKALISSSLDGTIRAHDLLRYRNFRTLTTPDPVQFTCLAVDNSGEVVCAGTLDPFHIYVWSLQTGRLIDLYIDIRYISIVYIVIVKYYLLYIYLYIYVYIKQVDYWMY